MDLGGRSMSFMGDSTHVNEITHVEHTRSRR